MIAEQKKNVREQNYACDSHNEIANKQDVRSFY